LNKKETLLSEIKCSNLLINKGYTWDEFRMKQSYLSITLKGYVQITLYILMQCI